MDKYTIDLDKVLNDFEYSELTESNGHSSTSQPVYNYGDKKYGSLPYDPQTYPKPSTTTKHSINNVFHSLNEYLNSDIKDLDQPVLSEINEIEASVPTFVSKPQASIQGIFKNIGEAQSSISDFPPGYTNFADSYLTKPNLISDYNLSYPSSSNLTEPNLNYPILDSANVDPNLSEPISSDRNQQLSKFEDPNLTSSQIFYDPVKSGRNFLYDTRNMSSNLTSTYSNLSSPYSSSRVETILNDAQITDANSEIFPNDNSETREINIEPENTIKSIENSVNDKVTIEITSDDTSEETIKFLEEYEPSFMHSNVTNHTTSLSNVMSNSKFISNNLLYSESSNNHQCISSPIEPVISLDFTPSVEPESLSIESEEPSDVTDPKTSSEFNYFESKNNINDSQNLLLPDQKYSDSNSVPEAVLSEKDSVLVEDYPNQEIRNDLSKNTNLKKVNNDTQEYRVENNDIGKTDLEKLDIGKLDIGKLDNEKSAVIESSEINNSDNGQFDVGKLKAESSPKEKVVGFEDDFEISDTEMENELAELEEEYKEKIISEAKILEDVEGNKETDEIVDNNCDNVLEEKQTCTEMVSESVNMETVNNSQGVHDARGDFSLLRPNSLDLNAESPTDNKPINLIGNPGSTPYNNVYLESSLDSDKNPGVTEPNQSLSPTASEVSTSEASDSPNTSDSCNDTSLDEHLNDKTPEQKDGEASSSPKEATPVSGNWLGKTAPFWTPDSDTLSCLHCNLKFTVIKRRHHCRACGLVLCSKCCNMKYKLEYMDYTEARVCTKCYDILSKGQSVSSGSEGSVDSQSPVGAQARPLNPGNPMDYCSVVPPLQQVGNVPVSPPSVLVPVGVLKRKGSGKSRSGKSVMFCDGIRPGCDLTELDYDFNYKETQSSSRKLQPIKINRNVPKLDTKTNSYIPGDENGLPPTVNVVKSEISYSECANNISLVDLLKEEQRTFALQRNLHVHVKIINMDCCINKLAWCFSTEGMIAVGQDEIVYLLEFVDNEKTIPKDMFLHLNNIYGEAVKGTSITEMGLSIHSSSNFLESKNHAGFLYVKPTFQCIQNVIIPKEPYLIGILIHRWETPWAKIFPLRLLLRLGAEYRYYPSPIISTRHRESVYVEIGHTIINLLADFRNFSYTLPNVRGLTIHMKEKNTTVSIPINRYDQVMKALNNSSDHILAFAANFSQRADSHLVCIQDTHGNNENAYTTHAINIHNKPRKVTGASFIVLNGALKSSSGLTAKSSIVEDGLMIQILPEQMIKLRTSLRNMKDFKINCGCVNAQSDEFVNIVWTENDVNFNVGVSSPIDNMALSGIPSIRVHNGRDYICNSGNKMIRWTEVFIIQSGDENIKTQEPVDISKLSESISKATCQALVKYLDLLATNSFLKIGIRTTLHVENVSYLAGANGVKLPPIYMKSLDNELIPILHKITTNNLGENAIVVELIFHILNM